MGRPRTLEDKPCATCSELFHPRERNARYCSPKCRHEKLSRAEKECPQCKTLFKGSYAQQKYCSHECKNVASRVLKTTICQHCSSVFERPHGKLRAYCSRSCAASARKVGKVANYSESELTTRTPGKWRSTHGYEIVKIDGKMKQVHRIAMEQKIGRKLLPSERVHHINGVRDDNRPENLELWISKGSSKKDPAGQRLEDLKAEFLALLSEGERSRIGTTFEKVFKV